MANTNTNTPPTETHRYGALKRLIAHELGIDYGDIATLGLAALAFFIYRKFSAPTGKSGTDVVNTSGLIDEALFRMTLTFFENASRGQRKGRPYELARIEHGRVCLEGNGRLIAEFVEGIHQALRETDHSLPAKFREYLFALLFVGQDGPKRVREWIEGLTTAQNVLTSTEEKWVQIEQGDATVQLFLNLARRVHTIIERNGLVESEWPKAYDEVAFSLIVSGDIKLPTTAQAKKKLSQALEFLEVVLDQETLSSWATETKIKAKQIKTVKALPFYSWERIKRDWQIWAIICPFVIIVLILLGVAVFSDSGTKTQTTTETKQEIQQ